jgi:hypothetical protein
MSTYLFFVLVCCLLILFTYLGFKLYSINIGLFILSFVLLSFIKLPRDLLIKFSRHEKFLFIVIVIIATLILIRAGIIDEGIIAIQDYPIHYFTHYLMATKMIPQYNSINGMYLNYQLGYSPLYDHPPGGPLLTTILWYLTLKKVPFWAIFRLVVAISFILPIFSVYYLSKTLGFHPFVSILSALLWLAWFHEYFIDGTFISYYSLSFGIFSIAFFVKYLEFRGKRNLLASGFFLASTLLFQSMFYPFFVISIFLLSLIRKRLKEFFYVFIISFLSGFVYFANFISWDYSFQIFSKMTTFFPHMYDINRAFWLHFYLLSVFSVIIGLPLLVYSPSKKSKWKIDYLFLVSISLIILSFLLNFFQTRAKFLMLDIFSSIFLIERITFLDRVFFCIIAAYSIYHIANTKKQFLIAFVLSLLILHIFTFVLYLFDSWYNSDSKYFEYIYGWKLKDWYSLKLDDGVLKNKPKEDVVELFDFLKENTTKDARIIVEDSRWGKLGGNIMALLAPFTDKFFVGGLHQGVFIEGDTWFVDGVILGKNITEYSERELAKKLEEYNVKWIVVWTNKSKSYIDNLPIFKKIYETSNKLFQVYEHSNIVPSYIYVGDGNASVKILNDDKIIISLNNVSKGGGILLKFRYEKYWQAFYNGKEIPIEKCGVLMCMEAPASGTYSIILSYKEGNLLKVAKIISLISLISLFIYLLKTSFIQVAFDKRAFGLREKRKLYSI